MESLAELLGQVPLDVEEKKVKNATVRNYLKRTAMNSGTGGSGKKKLTRQNTWVFETSQELQTNRRLSTAVRTIGFLHAHSNFDLNDKITDDVIRKHHVYSWSNTTGRLPHPDPKEDSIQKWESFFALISSALSFNFTVLVSEHSSE
jgi:hypothetical protein